MNNTVLKDIKLNQNIKDYILLYVDLENIKSK